MGLKQFNLDVKEAASSSVDSVSDIQRGDTGEFVFTYTPPDLAPIEIRALTLAVESYPEESSFLLFTATDHVDERLATWLQNRSTHVTNMTVIEMIQSLSTSLTAKLNSGFSDSSDETHPEIQDDGSDFEPLDLSDSEGEWDFDSDPLPSQKHEQDPSGCHTDPDLESSKRLKRHLRQLSNLGFFVFLTDMKLDSHATGIFSVAIQVSKLRIPDEVFEAWDLKSSDFIVMLVRLSQPYPTYQGLLHTSPDQPAIHFRMGKCASPRPTRKPAQAAFRQVLDTVEEDSMSSTDSMSPKLPSEADFVPLFLSGCLNSLLNEEFMGLFFLRRTEGLSWEQAQSVRHNMKRGTHMRTQDAEETLSGTKADQPGESWENSTLLDGLQHDTALEKEEDLNIILVATQFALHRLVRCTKYCMVCRQRTNDAFEAIKPYVCDSPLCLYQYLHLGFGQSVEHEIINNPYVVDLLISFFYSALSSNRLRVFPTYLNLKCPVTGTPQTPEKSLEVDVNFETKVIRFEPMDFSFYNSIKVGHSILLYVSGTSLSPSTQTAGNEWHTCLVVSIKQNAYTFRITNTRLGPYNLQPLSEELYKKTQANHPAPGWHRVKSFKHERDIDKLDSSDRNIALMGMTRSIPSVLEMREYLTQQPGRLLSSWGRMDASTLTLLHWIVASNRSCIVQDASVPLLALSSDDSSLDKTAPTNSNHVIGLDGQWMQFRFAQGSPDKEQVFTDELERYSSVNGKEKPYPSLFLWHGSPMGNWHSIIRTGFDFASCSHGRAYGDGVYFSSNLATSQGYSNIGANGMGWANTWPNSQLMPSAAISVCEVLNEPDSFVSKSPHYVVNKVEWIQCRYLFVAVRPKLRAMKTPFPRPPQQETRGYLPQDPKRKLMGDNVEIQIPASAIPARRRSAMLQRVPQPQSLESPVADSLDDIWVGMKDDLEMLSESEDEDRKNSMVRHRRRSSADSCMESIRPFKLTTAMQEAKVTHIADSTSLTADDATECFKPGTLDLESLPRSMEPSFAQSSPAALRSLNHEIKELQRIQAKSEIHALGWYVNFDKISNLFHWIVELHSFDDDLPLAQDMKLVGCSSVVMELRFGSSFPLSPPFVRVVRPRFLPFSEGGGGHVTMGGAICSELLTNSGWSPALSLEKVFLEVRMNLCDRERPARLCSNPSMKNLDYGFHEAMDAFRRAAISHGWHIPDMADIRSAASHF